MVWGLTKKLKVKDMRRFDKKKHIEKLNIRLNESKISEDFTDDMASHKERFTNPYDDDMAHGDNVYDTGSDVISSTSVINYLIDGDDMWNFERKLGFKNDSTQRAFYFETDDPTNIYFEVELDGNILKGSILAPDDEIIILQNTLKNIIGGVKIKDYPEKVAKAIVLAIKKYAEAFTDLEDSKEFRIKEGDPEDYYYPFDKPERDDDDDEFDPYKLKEMTVGLGDDLEYVDEDCGCSVNEHEPTDVKKSKWFSDEDGERMMDIQVD